MFSRLNLDHDKASVYVVDPKDAKKLLAFDVKAGALTGPSPVTRLGDASSDVTWVPVSQVDFVRLATAQAACATKYPGVGLTQLRLDDGYDTVHGEQGPPDWITKFGDKWCRATLAGEINFVD